jgi:hypothetical protein
MAVKITSLLTVTAYSLVYIYIYIPDIQSEVLPLSSGYTVGCIWPPSHHSLSPPPFRPPVRLSDLECNSLSKFFLKSQRT